MADEESWKKAEFFAANLLIPEIGTERKEIISHNFINITESITIKNMIRKEILSRD